MDTGSILTFVFWTNLSISLILSLKSVSDTFFALTKLSSNQSLTGRIFLLFAGKIKREKPWGIVYDAVTKLPIDPAIVTIAVRESGVGEFKQTRITDIQGRFSFLVTPGKYAIVAEKTNYRFPSQIVKGQIDGEYKNVYHGEIIEVENPAIINLNIPMDPVAYDWNQTIKKPQHKFRDIREKARSAIIVSGITCAALTYNASSYDPNLIVIFIYLLNLLFVKTSISKRLWGVVYYKYNNQKVPRVTIKAIRIPLNITVATTQSDHMGRYFLLLAHGIYTLQVETSEKGKTQILAKIDNVQVSKNKEVVNFDIGI